MKAQEIFYKGKKFLEEKNYICNLAEFLISKILNGKY